MNNSNLINIAIHHIKEENNAHGIGELKRGLYRDLEGIHLDVDTIKTDIITVGNGITNLSDSLGDLAWDNKVEKAKLGTTIIDGGYLLTSLIKTDDLVVGDNILLGPNAVITWEHLAPEIVEEFDVGKMVWLGELDDFPTDPKVNNAFYHSVEGRSYIWSGDEWYKIAEDGSAGEDGVNGYTPVKGTDYFDGKDGQDGESRYLWIRYSQNASGDPFTTSPTDAKYIGVATTTTNNPPEHYLSYTWSLIKGTDGIAGEDGENGQTSYLHIKYSDNGTTFTANNGETVGVYIGTYVDFIEEDSMTFSKYTWNKVKGDKGDKGDDGLPGEYYSPTWIKATSIDMRSISSPMIYANNASIVGILSGGTLEGTRIRQISGSTVIADVYKDSYGGKIIINNNAGGTCVTMGSESGYDDNRNGTIALYDGSLSNQRIALGIRKDTGFGLINIKDGSNVNRLILNGIQGWSDPHIAMLASNGSTGRVVIRGESTSYFNGGNVAIGKTTASYPLDVQGDIRLSGNLIGGGIGGESGTFTPTLRDVNNNVLTVTYGSSNKGNYYKIGNLVFINMIVDVTDISSLIGSSPIYFGGFPFRPKTDTVLSIGRTSGINYNNISNYTDKYFVLSRSFSIGGFEVTLLAGGSRVLCRDWSNSDSFKVYITGSYEY